MFLEIVKVFPKRQVAGTAQRDGLQEWIHISLLDKQLSKTLRAFPGYPDVQLTVSKAMEYGTARE